MIRFFIFLGLFFTLGPLWSQAIINIENLRRDGEIGTFLSSSFSYSQSSGNEERESYLLSLDLNINSQARQFLFVANQSKRMRRETVEDEMSFLHLRGTFPITLENMDLEVFIQRSENPFQRYQNRYLTGLGFRLAMTDELRFGSSLFMEEENSILGVNKKTNRANFYLRNAHHLNDIASLNYSFFFQPSINDYTQDYKSSFIMGLDFDISERFTIAIEFSHAYDEDPPDNAFKKDQSLITMFRYNFIN